jgi:hypothetical protein
MLIYFSPCVCVCVYVFTYVCKYVCTCLQGRTEICGRPGQSNNLAPLQTDVHYISIFTIYFSEVLGPLIGWRPG